MLKHLLLVSHSRQHEQTLFNWVLTFAQAQQASITLLRVLPEPDAGILLWFDRVLPMEVKQQQVQTVREEWALWKEQAAQAGVTLNTEVLFGKPFYKAVQYVMTHSVDWLIKQTDEHTHEPLGSLFNSQDKHLLRKCPCPVLLHKRGTALPFKKIMASIDVDLDADTLASCVFNQAILKSALQVAQQQGGGNTELAEEERGANYLEVVHAWQADAENLVHYWNPDLSEAELLKWTEEIRQQHLTAIEQEVEAVDAPEMIFDIVLPKGAVTEVIPQVVAQHQIDLLVMGTLGRNGLPGMIIGNTSESILEKINCSVLALKPDDFVSPISVTQAFSLY